MLEGCLGVPSAGLPSSAPDDLAGLPSEAYCVSHMKVNLGLQKLFRLFS